MQNLKTVQYLPEVVVYICYVDTQLDDEQSKSGITIKF